jgi:hypothetical protein
MKEEVRPPRKKASGHMPTAALDTVLSWENTSSSSTRDLGSAAPDVAQLSHNGATKPAHKRLSFCTWESLNPVWHAEKPKAKACAARYVRGSFIPASHCAHACSTAVQLASRAHCRLLRPAHMHTSMKRQRSSGAVLWQQGGGLQSHSLAHKPCTQHKPAGTMHTVGRTVERRVRSCCVLPSHTNSHCYKVHGQVELMPLWFLAKQTPRTILDKRGIGRDTRSCHHRHGPTFAASPTTNLAGTAMAWDIACKRAAAMILYVLSAD